ncbi:DUF4411 family protein [Dehalococcoides mccartyi]|uniref:DUF4411 family protein n=1 Tax=Dehalococcoides mccartyi TaxID=61435 RepID=UPI00107E73FD|nr:DUF4411 family protein [Dehalococcoides mccartyi]QBX63445.1 DUF4411 family protein [Dehalococcoides mccartyi]
MNTCIKNIYCLDSSVFVDIHRYYDVKEFWDTLDNSFTVGSIISHRIVFDELTTNAKLCSSLSTWISERRKYFFGETPTQARYVSEIVKLFPGIIDPFSKKDQADPWLIGLALERQSRSPLFPATYSVVSQESSASSVKIPAVCKHFNVKHLDLPEFMKDIGLVLSVKKI